MGLICGKSSTETTRSRREYGHRIIRSLAAHGKKSKKILCEMERSMAKATMKENCEVVIRLDGAPVVTLGGGKNRDVIEYEFLKKYKFMRLLGSGAYSMVFLADTKSESEDHDPELPPSLNIHNSINKSSATSHHHLSSMDHVAVKVVPRVIASEAYENAIRREALILKKVGSHPHIIRLHDFVISDRNFFLCMECAPSTCVDTVARLHLDENSEFQLSENTISSLFAQLLKALAHLHSLQIAHLDLKPDNLLISSDGTLRLADFGLAARTPCNRAAHTLLTCPPEIFKIRYFPFCVGSHETMGEFRDKVLCAEKSLPKILADADVSNSAHNLLTRLFDMNHKTRITAKQALEHAWFTNPCNKPKVHVEMLTKSVQHFKRCKYSLKSVVKATMIVARLSPPRSKK